MMQLPRDLYRPEQVGEMDRLAVDEFGMQGLTLMERAGGFAFEMLRAYWPDPRPLAVVCGTGNNGGDGFVIAELARQAGWRVRVLQMGDPEKISGDARTVAGRFLDAGGERLAFRSELLEDSELVVDAIFGTGLSREVEGAYRDAILAINDSGLPVLAVDVPSGLHAGTGMALGVAVHAQVTPTFLALKCGLFTGEAGDYCGQIQFYDLGVPAQLHKRVESAALRMDYTGVCHLLAPRSRIAHKGAFGHVLVVGGDHGMGGATRMSAQAAGRVGAGLVSAATRPEHCAAMIAGQPEIMCHPTDVPEVLESLLDRASVVILGPGLGRSDWSRALFEHALSFDGPMVVDADGLNLLAENPQTRSNWVLTPHPGEAARLLDVSVSDVQSDRFDAVAEISRRYGGTAVLKGAGSLVRRGGETPWLCTVGNPGMASGGMGDVLSGVIGGLLAQGMDLMEAAGTGVCLHGTAADRVAEEQGERGMLATDLLPKLHRLANPL